MDQVVMNNYVYCIKDVGHIQQGAIAKWLRRQIRNLFLFEGAGSNPAGVEVFCPPLSFKTCRRMTTKKVEFAFGTFFSSQPPGIYLLNTRTIRRSFSICQGFLRSLTVPQCDIRVGQRV